MNDNIYTFNLPTEEIGSALFERIDKYYDTCERTGRMSLWRKVYRAYYAMDFWGKHEASQVNRGGEQGELSTLHANHYRNLLAHLHVLVTQNRTSFECRSTNSDYKSQVQAILGVNILEYYLRDQRLDLHFNEAVEICLKYAESYIEVGWDFNAGEEIAADIETGEIIKSGEITTRVYAPYDVVRRIKQDNDMKQDWYGLRRWESKHELIAAHPEFAEELTNFTWEDRNPTRFAYPETVMDDDEDLIPVWTFYHERTAACPNGRMVKLVSPEIILEDRELPYKRMQVFRMAAFNQDGTSFGYSVSFDLLCVQEAINILYSTVLSNQATFGVQNLWVKPGSNISSVELAGGLNVIQSAEKPEALNLTNTPPEIFNFLQGLESLGEVLSGVNSVARGQPEASLKSGAALALVASQAVQFSNSLQSAHVRLQEDVGLAIIKTLELYASEPRTTAIAGKNNSSHVKEFIGGDLAGINRVIVDIGNPVTRTIAGRIELANALLQGQQLANPQQYIQVVTTGRLEPLIDDEQSESLLIDKENEALRDGQSVPITAVDQHVMHIKRHRAVLADPEARRNPGLVEVALDHINQHIQALRSVDSSLLNILGMAPIQPVPPGQVPVGQGEQAPQPPMNQPQEQIPNLPPEIAGNMPDLPQPPPGMPPLPQQ